MNKDEGRKRELALRRGAFFTRARARARNRLAAEKKGRGGREEKGEKRAGRKIF